MEDDAAFDLYLENISRKRDHAKRIKKNLNPKVRGRNCASALARVHETECSVWEGGLRHRKTHNGKEIRHQRAMMFEIEQYQIEISELKSKENVLIGMDKYFLPGFNPAKISLLEKNIKEMIS